jgi:hypothetical protein
MRRGHRLASRLRRIARFCHLLLVALRIVRRTHQLSEFRMSVKHGRLRSDVMLCTIFK